MRGGGNFPVRPPPAGGSVRAMPADPPDAAPDRRRVALLLIDVINDLSFPEGGDLLPHWREASGRIADLRGRAHAAGVPVIYVNDNFGRWRSDFAATVEHALRDDSLGAAIVERLRPDAERDYFVLKPRHSGFYHTVLDHLLGDLGAETLVLCGVAGNICVQMTAHDALLRGYRVVVPRDAVASNTPDLNDAALEQMRVVCKADVPPAAEVDFETLKHSS